MKDDQDHQEGGQKHGTASVIVAAMPAPIRSVLHHDVVAGRLLPQARIRGPQGGQSRPFPGLQGNGSRPARALQKKAGTAQGGKIRLFAGAQTAAARPSQAWSPDQKPAEQHNNT